MLKIQIKTNDVDLVVKGTLATIIRWTNEHQEYKSVMLEKLVQTLGSMR